MNLLPLTLAQWLHDKPICPQTRDTAGSPCMTIADGTWPDRALLWQLSDYRVSSVAGGSIWFTRR